MLELRAIALTAAPAMQLRPVKIVGAGVLAELSEAKVLTLRRTDPHTAGLLQRARAASRDRRAAVTPWNLRTHTEVGDEPARAANSRTSSDHVRPSCSSRTQPH